MPPKRRTPASAPANRVPVARPSRLAKEHGVTAAQEAEIKEAYALFAIADPEAALTSTRKKNDVDSTVIRTGDVRRCLIALNAPPNGKEEMAEILETLDPEKIGMVRFEHFFAVAALKLQTRFEDGNEDEEMSDAYEEEDEDVTVRGKGKGKARQHGSRIDAEVNTAFKLFTRDDSDQITLAHLRRVAKELREDIDDKTLKDMIREANGGGKAAVGLEDFGDVMRRAGVFG
ncbi:Calmodulin [Sphaceloma murrayae]|uniref:Calmodulin n=1 Tax=Sphaceloma murrayae TaxID=2082308 RepID=A0A2K1QW90_9PEZI|nr:Calmodulin [Sphaceloma murrayae]